VCGQDLQEEGEQSRSKVGEGVQRLRMLSHSCPPHH